ncbi:hypothetical protein ABIB60_001685 [Hymenobacter sp. UYP22]
MTTTAVVLLNETSVISLAGNAMGMVVILFGVIIGGVGVALLVSKAESKAVKAGSIFLLLVALCCFFFAYSLFA